MGKIFGLKVDVEKLKLYLLVMELILLIVILFMLMNYFNLLFLLFFCKLFLWIMFILN